MTQFINIMRETFNIAYNNNNNNIKDEKEKEKEKEKKAIRKEFLKYGRDNVCKPSIGEQ